MVVAVETMSWPKQGHSIPVEMDESMDPGQYQGLQEPVLFSSEVQRYASTEEQSLEAPSSLRSDLSLKQCAPGAAAVSGGEQHRFPVFAACGPRHFSVGRVQQNNPQHEQHQGLCQGPQAAKGVMKEVHVACPVDPGQIRTISLPEECKTVFITYSLDTAKDMIPFTRFLLANGFQPAIDIFESSIRSMDTTKWMDRFLNNKSMLIIVVISPQYKEDVEGLGPDEHRLHTKYIYKQIQNEFIQQGCLNYRLVPVLFPGASARHVPSWLLSTKLYRWPEDKADLLLRLFRMERYIVPLPGPGLTLSVRPLQGET